MQWAIIYRKCATTFKPVMRSLKIRNKVQFTERLLHIKVNLSATGSSCIVGINYEKMLKAAIQFSAIYQSRYNGKSWKKRGMLLRSKDASGRLTAYDFEASANICRCFFNIQACCFWLAIFSLNHRQFFDLKNIRIFPFRSWAFFPVFPRLVSA